MHCIRMHPFLSSLARSRKTWDTLRHLKYLKTKHKRQPCLSGLWWTSLAASSQKITHCYIRQLALYLTVLREYSHAEAWSSRVKGNKAETMPIFQCAQPLYPESLVIRACWSTWLGPSFKSRFEVFRISCIEPSCHMVWQKSAWNREVWEDLPNAFATEKNKEERGNNMKQTSCSS